MDNATNEPRPLNNSENVAIVWNDGTTWRWHVWVPGSDKLTARGSAPSEMEAHLAAEKAGQ